VIFARRNMPTVWLASFQLDAFRSGLALVAAVGLCLSHFSVEEICTTLPPNVQTKERKQKLTNAHPMEGPETERY
jgi:hypothetical protein